MVWRIWLANIVLAAAVFFAGMKSIEAWTEKRVLEIGSTQHPAPDRPEKRYAKKENPPETEYEVVVQDNLFFPDRSEPLEKLAEGDSSGGPSVVVGPQLQMLEQSAKQVSLYGIFITEDKREAFIGEIAPRKPGAPGGTGINRVKVGDTVGKFTVKEIQHGSVVLAAGGHEWHIALFDKDKPKQRTPVKKETGPAVFGGVSSPEAGSAPEAGKPPENEKEKQTAPEAPIPKRTLPGKGQSPREVQPVPNKDTIRAPGEALQPVPVPAMSAPEKR